MSRLFLGNAKMNSQLRNLAFWVGGILLVVLVTVFYQPAAAKTGSLLVWQDGQIYVLDIDSLNRKPVGPADADEPMSPSPGCLGWVKAPCWVAVGSKLYPISDGDDREISLPFERGAHWLDAPVSWSPDGLHLAYVVLSLRSSQTQLRAYNVATGQAKTLASGIDPTLAVAWTIGCVAGLEAATCQLGYKATGSKSAGQPHPIIPAWADEFDAAATAQPLLQLVKLTPRTGEQKIWPIPATTIFELRWTAANTLLYSPAQSYFHRAPDLTPAYQISPGSQLANISPDGRYTVYYEPFTRKECQAERPTGGCWYMGIWLAEESQSEKQRQLIYSRELSQTGADLLNTDPFWSPYVDVLILFREGNLIHYSLKRSQAAVWYSSLRGQLTSAPIFSPNQEAIALVYHQAEDPSHYHLLVIDPQFKPLAHVIDTQAGFRVLAWLPYRLQ